MFFTTQQNYSRLLEPKKNNEPMGWSLSLLNVQFIVRAVMNWSQIIEFFFNRKDRKVLNTN